MKGLEKLTSIRLAEALTQKDAIPNDVITDALYAQDRHGESFVDVLISTGCITEWDLAKLVVEQFQVPFVMASSFEICDEAKSAIPSEFLFEHLIVPLDRLDDTLTIVMPILTPFELLAKIRAESKCHVFPYVGLVTENKKVLGGLFPEFPAWLSATEKRREQERIGRDESDKNSSTWTSIFDSGDAKVRRSNRRPG